MEIASICLFVSATLTIQPDRSQFLLYESFNLTCKGNVSNWTVMRQTSDPPKPCTEWGRPNGTSCIYRSTYRKDSGSYWCQSGNACSKVLKITVTSGVILESPTLPVTEGDIVTLRCSSEGKNTQKSTSDFSAKFFRNGTFIGEQPNGTMTLSAAFADEGFYECEHPTKGKSPRSWLSIIARPQHKDTAPNLPLISYYLLCSILLFVAFTIMFIVCVRIYRRWARARAERKRRASDGLGEE